MQASRIQQLITELKLQPHPEGGFFREIFRCEHTVHSGERAPRSGLTSIYFLLISGAPSAWHRVSSAETWHWCEGSPLELLVCPPACTTVERFRVGPLADETPLSDHTEPVRVVPANFWQAAQTLGSYTLVSCDVGPGFDFADFALLRDIPEARTRLEAAQPNLRCFL